MSSDPPEFVKPIRSLIEHDKITLDGHTYKSVIPLVFSALIYSNSRFIRFRHCEALTLSLSFSLLSLYIVIADD